jgi:hypothetical protein
MESFWFIVFGKNGFKKNPKKITKSKKAIKIKIWNLNVLCTIVMHV